MTIHILFLREIKTQCPLPLNLFLFLFLMPFAPEKLSRPCDILKNYQMKFLPP